MKNWKLNKIGLKADFIRRKQTELRGVAKVVRTKNRTKKILRTSREEKKSLGK